MSNQSGQRPFILFGFMMNVVGHISAGLWRHPEDQAHRYTDIRYWVQIAKLLDDAGFDALFIADALGQLDVYQQQPNAALCHAAQMPVNDPMLLVSAMAAATRHLGFGITVSTTYEQPYLLARKFTTLDHLTNGRVAWNVVTSMLDSAARNLGLTQQLPHDERYDRAQEFLDVARKLSGSSPGANDSLLMVIASALLGVVFSRRLVPTIGGTLVSALFLSLIANGFQLINISSYWINGVEGLLILLVVSLTAVLRQRQQRRKVRV